MDEPIIPADAEFRIQLPTFEGPLDLLLHLIKKHELNILDLPIAFVTERYLNYLQMMQELDLDVASEYLLMAATLAHIKSKMLLPQVATEEAEEQDDGYVEDPRAELIRRLLEYQKYRLAADQLGSRPIVGRDVFARGIQTQEAQGPAPLAPVDLYKLLDAFGAILKRVQGRVALEVTAEAITINERMSQLSELLRERRSCRFEELFAGDRTRYEVVVTFLALLEMTKLRMTRVYQADPKSPIHIQYALLDPDSPAADSGEHEPVPAADAHLDSEAALEAAAGPAPEAEAGAESELEVAEREFEAELESAAAEAEAALEAAAGPAPEAEAAAESEPEAEEREFEAELESAAGEAEAALEAAAEPAPEAEAAAESEPEVAEREFEAELESAAAEAEAALEAAAEPAPEAEAGAESELEVAEREFEAALGSAAGEAEAALEAASEPAPKADAGADSELEAREREPEAEVDVASAREPELDEKKQAAPATAAPEAAEAEPATPSTTPQADEAPSSSASDSSDAEPDADDPVDDRETSA